MSELGTDPKGALGLAKPQLHLLPMAGMVAQAAAHQLGKEKYGERNWIQNKVASNTYISAIMRHAAAYKEGEDLDPESGVSHLGHIMAGCAILLDAAHAGTLVDDRVKIPKVDT